MGRLCSRRPPPRAGVAAAPRLVGLLHAALTPASLVRGRGDSMTRLDTENWCHHAARGTTGHCRKPLSRASGEGLG